MGSLFMVVVPIREHEAKLRQKEHNIRILQAETIERDAPRKSSGVSVHGLNEIGNGSKMSMSGASSTGSDHIDIYTAIVDGKPAQVMVSLDSMTIVKKNEDLNKFDEPVSSAFQTRKNKAFKGTTLEASVGSVFLEKHLEDYLTKFDIMNACWGQSVDGNYSQVSFTVASDKAEQIINGLHVVGIGTKYNSTLCVCSASVYYDSEEHKEAVADDVDDAGKKTKWNDFVASIKSRLTVAQVVQSVKANAIITFDYIVLIIVAGMIAGLGLVDDSAVNVVASMLVSPLMGPIMATTFGAVIRDKELIKIGLISELVGLFICLGIGYIFGICLQVQAFKGPWSDPKRQWPTNQMRGRSETNSLFVGIMVAIPSGAGVALSILAGNSGSLVGVAISASLLPPAVNCGMLWGLATVIAIDIAAKGGDTSPECNRSASTNESHYTTGHHTIYCANELLEFSFMGICSFGLTLINIIVIFFVGIVVLKIKEVAPHTTRMSLKRFWKEDLKIAREHNQQGRDVVRELEGSNDTENLLKAVEGDAVFNSVNRRNPFGTGPNVINDFKQRKIIRESQPTPVASVEQSDGGSGGGSSWGSWFGGIFGGKGGDRPPSKAPSKNQIINIQNEQDMKKRPKLK